MNDLESRLRVLNLREPAPGMKAGVLAAARTRSAGWRPWLAPHPAAWAALAALWLALAVLVRLEDAAAPQARLAQAAPAHDPLAEPTLLAFHLRLAAGLPPL